MELRCGVGDGKRRAAARNEMSVARRPGATAPSSRRKPVRMRFARCRSRRAWPLPRRTGAVGGNLGRPAARGAKATLVTVASICCDRNRKLRRVSPSRRRAGWCANCGRWRPWALNDWPGLLAKGEDESRARRSGDRSIILGVLRSAAGERESGAAGGEERITNRSLERGIPKRAGEGNLRLYSG